MTKFEGGLTITHDTVDYLNSAATTTLAKLQWPSVLWRCWLGGRKGIRPVKNLVVGCWRGYLSGARCRLPLTVSCFSKIQIGFTFLVPAHPGSPGKRATKRVCVCVYSARETIISAIQVVLWCDYRVSREWAYQLRTAVGRGRREDASSAAAECHQRCRRRSSCQAHNHQPLLSIQVTAQS